jgi:hypothetical protein
VYIEKFLVVIDKVEVVYADTSYTMRKYLGRGTREIPRLFQTRQLLLTAGYRNVGLLACCKIVIYCYKVYANDGVI